MELINALGNDLAIALFVEKRAKRKIKQTEFLTLIKEIRSTLERTEMLSQTMSRAVKAEKKMSGATN